MSRVWWLRHAPTHERAFCGWRDVPGDLSDRAALGRIATALPENALVGSSDLIRASATADAIAGDRPRLGAMPALREFDFGDWDGKAYSEVAQSHPELSRRYWEEPGDVSAPNGESWNAAAARVTAQVAQLCADHPGHDLVLVAHLGVILTQYARAAGLRPEQAIGQPIDNLSLTRLRLDAGHWHVELVNHRV